MNGNGNRNRSGGRGRGNVEAVQFGEESVTGEEQGNAMREIGVRQAERVVLAAEGINLLDRIAKVR